MDYRRIPRVSGIVFIDAKQHECLVCPGVHNNRRSASRIFQGLNLLLGKFDHECLRTNCCLYR